MPRESTVNAFAAGTEAVRERQRTQRAFIVAVGNQAKTVTPSPTSPVVHLPTAVTTVPTATSINWDCIAMAETGGDFTMHGATYSTAYGMVNDIIYEYASPEVQAKVFSGTATAAEQTDIAARFAADHGTGGWAALTKQKCGL